MKSITESIIGRKGASKVLRSFKDLQYGDVVEIYDDEDVSEYIYMPVKNIKQIALALEYDCFVTCGNGSRIIDYWPSSGFNQRFPKHDNFDDVKITRYITHIDEWQSISSGDDIKNLFNKYNIPINESIIGRKGISGTPELREHDIVMTNEHVYYMILTDPDEIRYANLNPNDVDKRNGILYRVRLYYGLQWLPLRQYTKTLEYQNDLNKSDWDIIAVYRGNYKWDPKHARDVCFERHLFKLIDRNYTLLWERK